MNPDPNLALINSSAQSPIQNPAVNLDPATDQPGVHGLVQDPSLPLIPSKYQFQNPVEIQTNTDMCPANCSVSSPVSEVKDPPKVQDPVQNYNQMEENDPNPVTNVTLNPSSVPNKTSYPVQLKNQNQTIILTKPSGPDQNSSQSITVKVPALALLKALVHNSGQTHVRIPLQTLGAGAVLVPSTNPSNIHLTASVQSLIQHPGIVKNKVQSTGIVLSPVRNPGSAPNPVQDQGLAENLVHNAVNLPRQVPNSVQVTGLAQKPNATYQTKTVAVNAAQNKSVLMNQTLESDPSLDSNLVRVPIPPEAVRALSPPALTTFLKPSVPPLGFRLNGKLIPLLPGGENVELFVRSHPSGSRSKMTSLHLKKAPAPPMFPKVPHPPVKVPRPSRKAPKESPQHFRNTQSPLKVTKTITHKSPISNPRPCVTLPRPKKPKADVATSVPQEGELIQKRPPDCLVCQSNFKIESELRGFICMCSSDLASALHILKLRRKDEGVKFRLKQKVSLLNQHQRVSKPLSFAASKSSSSLQKPLKTLALFPFMSRPSSSTGVSRPRPSATPGVQRPRPSVSPGVQRPRPSVSPGVQRPRPSVSPGVQRPRPSVSPGVQRTRPSVSPGVQRPRPSVSPSVQRPQLSPSPGVEMRAEDSSPGVEVTVGGATGRLVIYLEDFYYGSAEGNGALERFRLNTSYRCIHCSKELPNNISLMQHTRKHVKEKLKGYCHICFRHFSPVNLQRHLEVMHGPKSNSSRVICRICELEFETEIHLLMHMKETHKPGEMPYSCQYCGFRSSFYALTWRHFEEVHGDTRFFLCQFCLRLFKTEHNYQQHVAQHLRKEMYSCHRCRLHFRTAKEAQNHLTQFHGTHVRPAQLNGLRPGTVVSVRTFQKAPEESPVLKELRPVIVPKVQQKQAKTMKRTAVESLGEILCHLNCSDSDSCVECLHQVQNFSSHFPTRVNCSRCHFQTCCSRAYANHMIDNHSGKKMRPLHPQIFTSYRRLDGCCVECLTCGFSAQSGDAMALHLCKNRKHTCLCLLKDIEEEDESELTDELSDLSSRGGFISIENLSSSHLSINTLDRPAQLSSPVAMTITMSGPLPPRSKPSSPLSISLLSALLHSLLYGAAATSKRYGITQVRVGGLVQEQKKNLTNRRWRWDTKGGARWVLTEREQNRIVSQEAILDLSLRTLGPKISLQTRLNWAVDFLLRHDLGVETRSKELRDIAYSAVTSTWNKVNSLCLLPPRFCCLDEFPVFLDPVAFSSLAPEALRLWGEKEERPLVEVVLCGASDGTLLTPMLFYDKEIPPLPQGFPTNVIIQTKDGGYTLRERTRLWVHKVWLPHLGDSTSSLLLLDEHCGHTTSDFVEPMTHSGSELVYIPPGCGFLVQPLDQCVAPVLRNLLKVRWSQLVAKNLPDFTESDLILALGCWFSEVCVILNSNKDFIHRSFLCVGTRYKTAEFTHQALNQSLHQALIQSSPFANAQSEQTEGAGLPLLTYSQSEETEEQEKTGLQTHTSTEEPQIEVESGESFVGID